MTSLCARTAYEAGALLHLQSSDNARIMLADDLPLLHGHWASGGCVRDFFQPSRMGYTRMTDAWDTCVAKGRESEQY